jgi:trans-4-hydroxy-L-proline dehydratase
METLAPGQKIKEPKKLSQRIKWLRDYYFSGAGRKWNNEFSSWTTGTAWDVQYDEITYYIVPETYPFLETFKSSIKQASRKVDIPNDFYSLSLPERKAWFLKETMVKYVPHELLPGDLIAGGRFNVMTSMCWTEEETKEVNRLIYGKKGSRAKMKWFHDHGYGNSGATSGHIIPGYEKALKIGWKGIHGEIKNLYEALSAEEKESSRGAQLKAMMTSATLPGELAKKYSSLCLLKASLEKEELRKRELLQIAENLKKVPWEPAETFWEAMQALWLTHMLVMSDENYPGPGVSFGRIDQYLFPYWQKSLSEGMDREFGKEILKTFWIHANTAYDALIRVGANQGITAGYGQLITLSGMGIDGKDATNDLTYAILEVIDEMSPILEPKPNVRLHSKSPEKLLNKLVGMISDSQGAPFLLNFDERSMAGLMREAKIGNYESLINKSNIHDYAPVGCLENTMCGNDRSGTVDNNLNLLKAVELVLNNGKDLNEFVDPITGEKEKITQDGPKTGDPAKFKTWGEFKNAYVRQTKYIIEKCVDLYEVSESIRAKYIPTPYLSCLIKGCAEKGIDVTVGGAEIGFTTIEAVTYATTVDSLLAIKYLVFDKQVTTMKELQKALKSNWKGFEVLQTRAKNRAPKYGRDDDEADKMGQFVMELWTSESWKYKTISTQRRFRPGMLSWNYWVGDGFILAASADGRAKGQFLSNAICPSNGTDVNGPTSNTNSVGKVLGGRSEEGDWKDFVNLLPNGASHTITFNPSFIRDDEHKVKFKAFLKGYLENGGTALQINILDPEMLIDAQKHPQNYRHLLVRVTGYNAYFTSIGRELQDEIIARISHEKM